MHRYRVTFRTRRVESSAPEAPAFFDRWSDYYADDIGHAFEQADQDIEDEYERIFEIKERVNASA